MTIQNLPAYQKMGGVIATVASLLAISAPAQALTLIGNYSSINDGSFQPINGVSKKAVGFTLPTGSDYTLDSIRLRLELYETRGDVARLQIYADATNTSTNPNGASLQSVLFANPSSASSASDNFDFTPTSTFTFLNNTRYWLLVEATAGGYRWNANNPSITPTGVSGIVDISYQLTNNAGFSLPFYSPDSVSSSFQINATEVTAVPFEFNPALGLGVLGGFWLVRKGLKKKV